MILRSTSPSADRRRHHLWPELRRRHRQSPRLQHRSVCRGDPERHADTPGRRPCPTRAGHRRADGANGPDDQRRRRGLSDADLEGLVRQRRVAGYRIFRDGSQVGTSASTIFAISGLSCGSSNNSASPPSMPPGTCRRPRRPACRRLHVRNVGAVDTDGSCDQRRRPDVGDAFLGRVHRQRRVAGYRIFRNGAQVGTSSGTTYTATGLLCATSYTFGVAALDAAGNVSGTATKSMSTPACIDTTPPSTPTGLTSSGTGQTSVALSWNGSTDDYGVTGYRLYQNGSQVGASSSVGYIFGGLTCATNYNFGVAAVDGAGNVRRSQPSGSRPQRAPTSRRRPRQPG